MGKEIERKFLIDQELWQPKVKGSFIRQGYLSTDKERVVRIRQRDDKAYITIKGATQGISRAEFEYDIPKEEAGFMLEKLCHQPILEKIRYSEEYFGKLWEIDVFKGENEGLVVAEIELSSAEEEFSRPKWITEEVSGDPKYYNSNLLTAPFKKWKK